MTPAFPELLPTHGGEVCDWIESFLVHSKGDFYAKPWRLTREQRRLIYRLCEYRANPTPAPHEPDWIRQYRRALVGRPKGYGKTEFAAAFAVTELAGPVAPVAPDIPVAAASFDQADKVFDAAKTSIEQGPLAPYFECYDTEILRKDTAGRLYRVAAQAGTLDGGGHTLRVADEVHEWEGRKERVHLVLTNGLAKRANSLGLDISTAGADDPSEPQTLLGKLFAKGKAIEAGEITDPTFLFDWIGHPDMECPLNTEEQVWEAARIAYAGAGPHVRLEDVVSRFYEIDEAEWRRYYLNQFTRAAEFWLPSGAWANLADPDHYADVRGTGPEGKWAPEGTPVVLGFDGSYSGDSTALYGWDLTGSKPHGFLIAVWERPKRAGDDWRVPESEVQTAIHGAFQRWRVRHLVADPPYWHKEIEEWAEKYGQEVVVRYETNKPSLMGPACSKAFAAIKKSELTHCGDPRAGRHFNNAKTKETPNGAYIVKEHRNSKKKIDVAVAAVIGLDVGWSGSGTAAPFYLTAKW